LDIRVYIVITTIGFLGTNLVLHLNHGISLIGTNVNFTLTGVIGATVTSGEVTISGAEIVVFIYTVGFTCS